MSAVENETFPRNQMSRKVCLTPVRTTPQRSAKHGATGGRIRTDERPPRPLCPHLPPHARPWLLTPLSSRGFRDLFNRGKRYFHGFQKAFRVAALPIARSPPLVEFRASASSIIPRNPSRHRPTISASSRPSHQQHGGSLISLLSLSSALSFFQAGVCAI